MATWELKQDTIVADYVRDNQEEQAEDSAKTLMPQLPGHSFLYVLKRVKYWKGTM